MTLLTVLGLASGILLSEVIQQAQAQSPAPAISLVCDDGKDKFDLSVDLVRLTVSSRDKQFTIRNGDASTDTDGHRHAYFVTVTPDHVLFGQRETWGAGSNQTDTADLDRRTGRLNYNTT